MTQAKRYSPLIILFDLYKMLKNYFFVFIILFVFRANSDGKLIVYGRYIFFLGILLSLLSILLKWWSQKYVIDNHAFHIYKGVFKKTAHTIPFSKIQNVNRHTSFFHRLLQMTAVNFETGLSSEDQTVSFKVLTVAEANEMIALVESFKKQKNEEKIVQKEERYEEEHEEQPEEISEVPANGSSQQEKIIHFEPTSKDIIKASFTSFSFLILLPIIGSLYVKASDYFEIDKYTDNLLLKIMNSWIALTIIILLFIIISMTVGMIRTYLKYGKYEISSDNERIYISRGIVNETSFSIRKDRVQAIEMNQSFIKKILGLTEVKLATAGAFRMNDDGPEMNTLYPFLPVKTAYRILEEALPDYVITREMQRLPKKAFWVKLLKPSWMWIILTGVLYYFKPPLLQNEELWKYIPLILLLLMISSRILAYMNTRFIIHDQFIQMKTGGFTSSLFISKREKVTEVEIVRSIFQQKLGLASITTYHRGQPFNFETIDNISLQDAKHFIDWYKNRSDEVAYIHEKP